MNTPGSQIPSPVSAIGERGLIERIRRRFPAPPGALIVGIGDDAAVVKPERGALQVLTTDATVEGVHFERRYSSLEDVGYRALAVNISDVAAMGGAPSLALLSLLLPSATTAEDVDALAEGFAVMASEAGVTLAGGNLSATSGPLVVDVTVIGTVRPRRVLTRGGGRPGHELFVTGSIGAAAAGLRWLAGGGRSDPEDPAVAECVQRYRRPTPRARLGALLGRTRAASACMDLSDGLADAVHQLAEASGTGAEIDAALLPIHPGARAASASPGDVLSASLASDDYELLFSVPPRSGGRLRTVIGSARGIPVTKIGRLTQDPRVVLLRAGQPEPLPCGFHHF